MDTAIFSSVLWVLILWGLIEGMIFPCSLFTGTTVNGFHSSAGKPINVGEVFEYHVEQSDDLETWETAGVVLEQVVDLGGGMERATYVTSDPLPSGQRKFVRLRITIP